MDWIIDKSENLKFHTILSIVTHPFVSQINNYNWLISDLEFCGYDSEDKLINFEEDCFLLSPADFISLVKSNVQIIWGAILALPKDHIVDLENLPFVEGNDKIWQTGNMQIESAQIEIDCFDSSFTIVKFKSEELSNQFKEYFPEAIKLSVFNQQ